MNDEKTYSEGDIQKRLDGDLVSWVYQDGHITRQYNVNGWKSALLVANAIGHLAEIAWHHPDLLVSYGSVTVRLMTHSARGITDKDFELARKIEQTVHWKPGDDPGLSLNGTPDEQSYAYIKD